MPLPINGHHQEETVKPGVIINTDVMGRENVQPTHTRPSFVRQRSRVERVEDDLDINSDLPKSQNLNGHKCISSSETGQKSVHFDDGASGDEFEGIDIRPSEEEELCSGTTQCGDNKNEKVRERDQKKKVRRKQWLCIGIIGSLVLVIAATALGFSVYNHVKSNQKTKLENPDHGTLFCYPCDYVKAEDIITFNEKYNMCCIGKDAELRTNPGEMSPLVQEEKETDRYNHKVKFNEIGINVRNSFGGNLSLQLQPDDDKDQSAMFHLVGKDDTGIMIDESGLYMLTLTLTTRAPFGNEGSYFRFMSCLKFNIKKKEDDECRKVTLLPNTGDPFDIHKTDSLERGTIIRVTTTHKNLLDSNTSLNKLQIVQLHKS